MAKIISKDTTRSRHKLAPVNQSNKTYKLLSFMNNVCVQAGHRKDTARYRFQLDSPAESGILRWHKIQLVILLLTQQKKTTLLMQHEKSFRNFGSKSENESQI